MINSVKINNLRFTDHTVLLATSTEDLRKLFDVGACNACPGLNINSKKTKVLVISKQEVPLPCQLHQGSTPIEQVTSFNYLGSLITSDIRCKKEMCETTGLAKDAFSRLS